MFRETCRFTSTRQWSIYVYPPMNALRLSGSGRFTSTRQWALYVYPPMAALLLPANGSIPGLVGARYTAVVKEKRSVRHITVNLVVSLSDRQTGAGAFTQVQPGQLVCGLLAQVITGRVFRGNVCVY